MGLTIKIKDLDEIEKYKSMMTNWSTFKDSILSLSERELKKALYVELTGSGREFIANRIRGRINKIRIKREKSYIERNTWR